ncbi:Sas10/Utp3/C1D family-domain-containing protein [Aspergillus pseudonomiae]|uniref:Exosome complex protein n=1 Tax=Aspergillus pseudonomiae TaxID=1506151 RepID=A0A5N7DCA3_9EURO|nr:Sas10/Utp3/C1D family-domain-containing protein [Aspergillus pseudonomiae]KAB8258169.1 Sas10/Utp3/C1D family-domain-containing protein [Aspergillus pseudonomiae]KAE8403869.1 Sas10/Utp3/C1D family-domain-containing protein [Aspergillus pseudonomiae]
MDATDLLPLLEQLDDHVDDLEEALGPVLNSAITDTSKKLPVLDKAKFHVLITYALESLIFSYLRLHGVNAKEHPVFRELTRVKQYFEKIKALEAEPEQRTLTLDKQAASRFIKHGLAGNDKFDMERKEQQAKEKARAQLKASLLAKKAAAAAPETSSKKSGTDSESGSDSESDSEKAKATTHSGDSAKKSKETKVDNTVKRTSAKNKKKRSKDNLKDEKKDRRKKKQESRKARKAQ